MRHPLNKRELAAGIGGLVLLSGVSRAVPAWGAPRFDAFPFSLGVAAGDPSPDGFVIWTRLAPRPLEPQGGMPRAVVPVRWEVAEDERFNRIVRCGETLARPELAHAVHVEVEGLHSGRPYWYRFHMNGTSSPSPTGKARTAPQPSATPAAIRLAVAGCQHYEHGFFDGFRHLGQEPDLDAVFHYGDYIYEGNSRFSSISPDDLGRMRVREHLGDEPYSLDDYRRRYAQYKSDPDLQSAHASAAFIMSFDDHEIDNNWAGDHDQDGTPPAIFRLRRLAAMQAWYEHMPVRKTQFPRADGLSLFRRLDYGRLVRIHVLDTRSHRSPLLCAWPDQTECRQDDGPDRSLLGSAQESWLAQGLEGEFRWNLIAQQVLCMPLVRRDQQGQALPRSADNWDGYPGARRRLVQAIIERGLTNVVIASGDAHQTFAGTVPIDDGRPDGPAAATEFLTTSMTSGGDGLPILPTFETVIADNPNLAFNDGQRGYQVFTIRPEELRVDVKRIDRVLKRGGDLSLLNSFEVTPDRAGLHEC